MVQISNSRLTSDGAERVRRRAETRRREILRAAARTFRRRGFATAGMREIASEAGLSPGNLYHYFEGKDQILYYCQDRWLDQMLGVLRSIKSTRRTAAETLREVLAAHVRCLLDELEGAAAHLEVEALPPELRDRIVAKRDRYERGIRRVVSAGIRSGELVACDSELVTRAILGAVNWTARWYRPEGSRSASEVAESMAGYLVRGLQARPTLGGRRR